MAAYNYSYGKMSGLFKNPPEVAGEVFEELERKGIVVTPKSLLEASRSESAPLHNEFEWDDAIAGEKYRQEQAHLIIKCLIIEEIELDEPSLPKNRAFVYTGSTNTGYVRLNEALKNKEWRNNLIKAAKRDMLYFINKYDRLEELTNVIEQMKQILSQGDAG